MGCVMWYLGMRSQDVVNSPWISSNSEVANESSVNVTFWAELKEEDKMEEAQEEARIMEC